MGGERLGTFCKRRIGQGGNEFGDSQRLVSVSGAIGERGDF